MNIRTAVMDDLDAITCLEASGFPEAEAATRESFEKRLAVFADHFWLLEDVDHQLISMVNGMVTNQPILEDRMYEDAEMHDENGDWQMIFGVVTAPERQRNGYAAQVMRHVIGEAKKQGRKGLVLTCKKEKIAYYEKFGYVCEGESASVHGNVVWYDMRLTL